MEISLYQSHDHIEWEIVKPESPGRSVELEECAINDGPRGHYPDRELMVDQNDEIEQWVDDPTQGKEVGEEEYPEWAAEFEFPSEESRNNYENSTHVYYQDWPTTEEQKYWPLWTFELAQHPQHYDPYLDDYSGATYIREKNHVRRRQDQQRSMGVGRQAGKRRAPGKLYLGSDDAIRYPSHT